MICVYSSIDFEKCVMLFIHHYKTTQNSFTLLKSHSAPSYLPLPSSSNPQNHWSHSLLFVLFPKFWNHTACSLFKLAYFTEQYTFKFFHVVCGLIIILFSCRIMSYVQRYYSLSIHLLLKSTLVDSLGHYFLYIANVKNI